MLEDHNRFCQSFPKRIEIVPCVLKINKYSLPFCSHELLYETFLSTEVSFGDSQKTDCVGSKSLKVFYMRRNVNSVSLLMLNYDKSKYM